MLLLLKTVEMRLKTVVLMGVDDTLEGAAKYLAKSKHIKTIGYACDIKRVEKLQPFLQAKGIKYRVVTGKLSMKLRQRALKQLETGVIHLIVCVKCFIEAIDANFLHRVVYFDHPKGGTRPP